MKKIILILLLVASFLTVDAGVIDFESINSSAKGGNANIIEKVTDNSLDKISGIEVTNGQNLDPVKAVNSLGFKVFQIAKILLQSVALIYVVYIGIQMVISMGTDEEELKAAKNQLWYVIVGVLFIQLPETIYRSISQENYATIGGSSISVGDTTPATYSYNLFFNNSLFNSTLNEKIIGFLEIALAGVAIIMIIYAGIKILLARGNEDQVKEGKNKILWSLVGLIFVSFIEAWRAFAYSGNIKDGANIFETISNLVLFFAGPIIIFYFILAGYYYITANGEEDRISKAKNIIINTLLGIIILFAAYAFLTDLKNLSF